ncbi:MAG: hypothetical protein WCS37_10085 [Chloroflexota bacterium]
MNEPIVIVGGFLSQGNDYRPWQARFQSLPYNRKTYIVPLTRLEWLSKGDDTFRHQIPALQAVVEQARRETKAEKVWLVCHSAGGRIARLWMGEKSYHGNRCGGHPLVRGVIFLGSPYFTEEPWAVKSSKFANLYYPGAFYPEIKYVSVIGKAIFGRPNGSISERVAHSCYKYLHPENPKRWGDGVITVSSANVPGANNIILDNVHHVAFLGRPGYLEPDALAIWGKHLLPD